MTTVTITVDPERVAAEPTPIWDALGMTDKLERAHAEWLTARHAAEVALFLFDPYAAAVSTVRHKSGALDLLIPKLRTDPA